MRTAKPHQPQTLVRRLSKLQDVLSAGLKWTDDHREATPRLSLEADTLGLQLRRARVRVDALAHQIERPVTLALYGQSQAGKAWLLSEMPGDARGQLMSRFGDKTLNFFQHINPGNLDFATATRFTHQRASVSDEWPVELELLSEADILRWMLSCIKSHRAADVVSIEQQIKRLQRQRLSTPLPGLDSDALVILWGWSRRHNQHAPLLDRHFWPLAIELAPSLSVDDRAQLFGLLWPSQPELTETLRNLLHLRHQLHNASRVLAPLSLLVDNALLPAERLIAPPTEQDATLLTDVCPLSSNRIGKPQSVPLGLLSLLTLELVIPLTSTPRTALFDDADMLELPAPGTPVDPLAREERALLTQQEPFRALLLEQKRALLPGLYAARQGIDLLLVCTAASQREDVDLASRTLREWQLHQLNHENDDKPRLIWAITPYDPRYQHINVDEAVQRQVGQPGHRWGSMLALDRAGVDRMASWLQEEMQPDARREKRVAEMLQLEKGIVEQYLLPWTEAGASPEQAARKQQIADTLLKCLQHRTGLHGELLERLQPPREALRQLWLNRHAAPESTVIAAATPTAQHFGIGFEFDLFSEAPQQERPASPASKATANASFPLQVLALWFDHLRQLPENRSLLTLLNIDNATLACLVEELITASFRMDILDKLQQALHETENLSVSHESRADRQVSRAMTVLGDFVAWLGFLDRAETDRPASRVNRGHPVFARPPAPDFNFSPGKRLTRLSAAPANHTAYYIYDWLVGLNSLIVENNGHSGGSELPSEVRESLAVLMAPLRS